MSVFVILGDWPSQIFVWNILFIELFKISNIEAFFVVTTYKTMESSEVLS